MHVLDKQVSLRVFSVSLMFNNSLKFVYFVDVQRPKSSDRSSPSLTKRIKVERIMEEPPVKSTVKIRHNPHKLKFLEGLGLVTVDKKKGNPESEVYDSTYCL